MTQYLRINITTEGPTEHRFVKDVLYYHLQPLGKYCEVRSVLTNKDLKKRGGLSTYKKAKNDIHRWMSNDNSSEARFTTMFDFYALPSDFPGMEEAQKRNDKYDKINCIEAALKNDIQDDRFIPYIQLHEFEALIFTNLDMLLLEYNNKLSEIQELKQVLSYFNDNPELVNNNKDSSPSHRIKNLIPEYQKVSSGSIITSLIGLENLKQTCKHFREWIQVLENL